jgi:hypothetical protein
MRNTLYKALMLAAIPSLAAHAQNANLSGTWKLNVARSFMGQEHPFADYDFTKKIELNSAVVSITDTALHNSTVNVPLPDTTTSLQVATDGKEHEIQLTTVAGRQSVSTIRASAEWQGNNLQVVQFASGLANMTKHRLYLSADGLQLIDHVESYNIYGDTEQRLVFDKIR